MDSKLRWSLLRKLGEDLDTIDDLISGRAPNRWGISWEALTVADWPRIVDYWLNGPPPRVFPFHSAWRPGLWEMP